MTWKNSLNFSCFSIYQQSSFYLIFLPFLSQVIFFLIHSFLLLSSCFWVIILHLFLIFLIFVSLTKFLIIYFRVLVWVGFFFLYVVHSALSHLCHNVLTFLIYSTQERHTKLWITLVNYPAQSSLQLFQKEQSVTGFICSLTLCLVHFCIWNFPLQFAI